MKEITKLNFKESQSSNLIRVEARNDELEKEVVSLKEEINRLSTTIKRSSIRPLERNRSDISLLENEHKTCKKCEKLREELNDVRAENDKQKEQILEKTTNLKELEKYDFDLNLKLEERNFKLKEVANFCKTFEKATGNFEMEDFQEILNELYQFVCGESLKISWKNQNNEQFKVNSIKKTIERKNEDSKNCLASIDLLEEEVEKFRKMFELFPEALKNFNNQDSLNKSQGDSNDGQKKDKEGKKQEYFQKIWNLDI